MLTQLIYHSRYVSGEYGALGMVRNILQTSEINNGRDDITGFLIFDKSHFLQILEGDAQLIESTFQRIRHDPRHRDLVVLATQSIEARKFTDWAMGGYVRSPESDAVYARYGIDGELDPTGLTGDKVLALALDLLAFETARQKERVVGIGTPDPI
jgi:hypothetical protein